MNELIGFIGQGWIGRNYADDFERRGFNVVRFSQEEPYRANKEKIAQCDIVFIAVPTPTTPNGFDDSIVRSVIPLVGKGKIAVIKSTVLPGTTESIQKENPDVYVLHSPEFLTEATASHDAAYPLRNIIGIPVSDDVFQQSAKRVLAILPKAPFELICAAREAELIKYAGNSFLYSKVVFMNMLYDLAEKLGCTWEAVQSALAADQRIGNSHLNPIHQGGRGAGGNCFIKDFAAFSELYENLLEDEQGVALLRSLVQKNNALLTRSGKDVELLRGVYGENRL